MKKMMLMGLMIMSFSAFADKVTVGVNGMVCSMCAQGITKKLNALKVDEIKVDLDHKLVTFTTNEKNPVSDEAIKKLIEESGYAITKVERK
ncbi:MAG: cation transporter [Bacteriovoracaceae bacterium]|nr:cation transporter [Bacteriovoracaceae bacterium]